MTEREKQIEDMAKTLCGVEKCSACDIRCGLYRMAHDLYYAGYRKTFASSLGSGEQQAYKEGYANGFSQARRSTVEDFVKFAKDAQEQGYDGIGELDIIEYADENYEENENEWKC